MDCSKKEPVCPCPQPKPPPPPPPQGNVNSSPPHPPNPCCVCRTTPCACSPCFFTLQTQPEKLVCFCNPPNAVDFSDTNECKCPDTPLTLLEPLELKEIPDLENVSAFSIHTMDMDYMKNIKLLTDKETALRREIALLQRKEEAYIDTLKKADTVWKQKQCAYQKNLSHNKENLQTLQTLKLMKQQLEEDNKRLNADMKQIEEEFRKYHDEVGMPLTHQLEKERMKNQHLENQLEEDERNVGLSSGKMETEIMVIRKDFENIMQRLAEINEQNAQTQNENNNLMCRITALQQDLDNQRKSEAHVIHTLKEAIDKQKTKIKSTNCVCCKCALNAEKAARTATPPSKIQDKAFLGSASRVPESVSRWDGEETEKTREITPRKHTEIVYEPDGEIPVPEGEGGKGDAGREDEQKAEEERDASKLPEENKLKEKETEPKVEMDKEKPTEPKLEEKKAEEEMAKVEKAEEEKEKEKVEETKEEKEKPKETAEKEKTKEAEEERAKKMKSEEEKPKEEKVEEEKLKEEKVEGEKPKEEKLEAQLPTEEDKSGVVQKDKEDAHIIIIQQPSTDSIVSQNESGIFAIPSAPAKRPKTPIKTASQASFVIPGTQPLLKRPSQVSQVSTTPTKTPSQLVMEGTFTKPAEPSPIKRPSESTFVKPAEPSPIKRPSEDTFVKPAAPLPIKRASQASFVKPAEPSPIKRPSEDTFVKPAAPLPIKRASQASFVKPAEPSPIKRPSEDTFVKPAAPLPMKRASQTSFVKSAEPSPIKRPSEDTFVKPAAPLPMKRASQTSFVKPAEPSPIKRPSEDTFVKPAAPLPMKRASQASFVKPAEPSPIKRPSEDTFVKPAEPSPMKRPSESSFVKPAEPIQMKRASQASFVKPAETPSIKRASQASFVKPAVPSPMKRPSEASFVMPSPIKRPSQISQQKPGMPMKTPSQLAPATAQMSRPSQASFVMPGAASPIKQPSQADVAKPLTPFPVKQPSPTSTQLEPGTSQVKRPSQESLITPATPLPTKPPSQTSQPQVDTTIKEPSQDSLAAIIPIKPPSETTFARPSLPPLKSPSKSSVVAKTQPPTGPSAFPSPLAESTCVMEETLPTKPTAPVQDKVGTDVTVKGTAADESITNITQEELTLIEVGGQSYDGANQPTIGTLISLPSDEKQTDAKESQPPKFFGQDHFISPMAESTICEDTVKDDQIETTKRIDEDSLFIQLLKVKPKPSETKTKCILDATNDEINYPKFDWNAPEQHRFETTIEETIADGTEIQKDYWPPCKTKEIKPGQKFTCECVPIPLTTLQKIDEQEVVIKTDVKMKDGKPDVDAKVSKTATKADDVKITTEATDDGGVKVRTESKEGIIDTRVSITKTGQMEVVTEITGPSKPTGTMVPEPIPNKTSEHIKTVEPIPSEPTSKLIEPSKSIDTPKTTEIIPSKPTERESPKPIDTPKSTEPTKSTEPFKIPEPIASKPSASKAEGDAITSSKLKEQVFPSTTPIQDTGGKKLEKTASCDSILSNYESAIDTTITPTVATISDSPPQSQPHPPAPTPAPPPPSAQSQSQPRPSATPQSQPQTIPTPQSQPQPPPVPQSQPTSPQPPSSSASSPDSFVPPIARPKKTRTSAQQLTPTDTVKRSGRQGTPIPQGKPSLASIQSLPPPESSKPSQTSLRQRVTPSNKPSKSAIPPSSRPSQASMRARIPPSSKQTPTSSPTPRSSQDRISRPSQASFQRPRVLPSKNASQASIQTTPTTNQQPTQRLSTASVPASSRPSQTRIRVTSSKTAQPPSPIPPPPQFPSSRPSQTSFTRPRMPPSKKPSQASVQITPTVPPTQRPSQTSVQRSQLPPGKRSSHPSLQTTSIPPPTRRSSQTIEPMPPSSRASIQRLPRVRKKQSMQQRSSQGTIQPTHSSSQNSIRVAKSNQSNTSVSLIQTPKSKAMPMPIREIKVEKAAEGEISLEPDTTFNDSTVDSGLETTHESSFFSGPVPRPIEIKMDRDGIIYDNAKEKEKETESQTVLSTEPQPVPPTESQALPPTDQETIPAEPQAETQERPEIGPQTETQQEAQAGQQPDTQAVPQTEPQPETQVIAPNEPQPETQTEQLEAPQTEPPAEPQIQEGEAQEKSQEEPIPTKESVTLIPRLPSVVVISDARLKKEKDISHEKAKTDDIDIARVKVEPFDLILPEVPSEEPVVIEQVEPMEPEKPSEEPVVIEQVEPIVIEEAGEECNCYECNEECARSTTSSEIECTCIECDEECARSTTSTIVECTCPECNEDCAKSVASEMVVCTCIDCNEECAAKSSSGGVECYCDPCYLEECNPNAKSKEQTVKPSTSGIECYCTPCDDEDCKPNAPSKVQTAVQENGPSGDKNDETKDADKTIQEKEIEVSSEKIKEKDKEAVVADNTCICCKCVSLEFNQKLDAEKKESILSCLCEVCMTLLCAKYNGKPLPPTEGPSEHILTQTFECLCIQCRKSVCSILGHPPKTSEGSLGCQCAPCESTYCLSLKNKSAKEKEPEVHDMNCLCSECMSNTCLGKLDAYYDERNCLCEECESASCLPQEVVNIKKDSPPVEGFFSYHRRSKEPSMSRDSEAAAKQPSHQTTTTEVVRDSKTLSKTIQSTTLSPQDILKVMESMLKQWPVNKETYKCYCDGCTCSTCIVHGEQKETMGQEQNNVMQKEKQVAQEQEQVVREQEQVVQEQEQVVREQEQVVQEQEQVVREQEQVVREQDQIVREQEQVVQVQGQVAPRVVENALHGEENKNEIECYCELCNDSDCLQKPTSDILEFVCTCDPCKCAECPADNRKNDDNNYEIGDAENELFEELLSDFDCQCKTCTCVICADKKLFKKDKVRPQVEDSGMFDVAEEEAVQKVVKTDVETAVKRVSSTPETVCKVNTHTIDCNCPECRCELCPDKNMRPTKSFICDCKICTCLSCKGQMVNDRELSLGVNCDCSICTCNPCTLPKPDAKLSVPSKESPKKPLVHSASCTCPECDCDICLSTHESFCDCETCSCTDCQLLTKDGLPPKKMQEKSEHAGDCGCKECLKHVEKLPSVNEEVVARTIVLDQSAPQQNKVHSMQCLCPECHCSDGLTPAQPSQKCGCCGVCQCNPCKDPTVKRPKVHSYNCNCCECSPSCELEDEGNCDCCECSSCDIHQTKDIPQDSCYCCECTECQFINNGNLDECDCCECNTCPFEFEEAVETIAPAAVVKVVARAPASGAGDIKQQEQHEDTDESCICKEECFEDCNAKATQLPEIVKTLDPKASQPVSREGMKDAGCLCCECNECPGTINKQTTTTNTTPVHPDTCLCPECVEDFCGAKDELPPRVVGAISEKTVYEDSVSPTTCTCTQCLAEICTAKLDAKDNKPAVHPLECKCLECAGDSCKDKAQQTVDEKPVVLSEKKEDCDCYKICTCQTCPHDKPANVHPMTCNCFECAGDCAVKQAMQLSPDIEGIITKTTQEELQQTPGNNLNKKKENCECYTKPVNIHPMTCECLECAGDCLAKQNQKSPSTRVSIAPSVEDQIVKTTREVEKAIPTNLKETHPNCAECCGKCVCTKCSPPQEEKQTLRLNHKESTEEWFDTAQTMGSMGCVCAPCKCSYCLKKMGDNVNEDEEFVEPPLHGFNCNCLTCGCSGCPDIKKQAQSCKTEVQENIKIVNACTLESKSKDESTQCDCPTCQCIHCPDSNVPSQLVCNTCSAKKKLRLNTDLSNLPFCTPFTLQQHLQAKKHNNLIPTDNRQEISCVTNCQKLTTVCKIRSPFSVNKSTVSTGLNYNSVSAYLSPCQEKYTLDTENTSTNRENQDLSPKSKQKEINQNCIKIKSVHRIPSVCFKYKTTQKLNYENNKCHKKCENTLLKQCGNRRNIAKTIPSFRPTTKRISSTCLQGKRSVTNNRWTKQNSFTKSCKDDIKDCLISNCKQYLNEQQFSIKSCKKASWFQQLSSIVDSNKKFFSDTISQQNKIEKHCTLQSSSTTFIKNIDKEKKLSNVIVQLRSSMMEALNAATCAAKLNHKQESLFKTKSILKKSIMPEVGVIKADDYEMGESDIEFHTLNTASNSEENVCNEMNNTKVLPETLLEARDNVMQALKVTNTCVKKILCNMEVKNGKEKKQCNCSGNKRKASINEKKSSMPKNESFTKKNKNESNTNKKTKNKHLSKKEISFKKEVECSRKKNCGNNQMLQTASGCKNSKVNEKSCKTMPNLISSSKCCRKRKLKPKTPDTSSSKHSKSCDNFECNPSECVLNIISYVSHENSCFTDVPSGTSTPKKSAHYYYTDMCNSSSKNTNKSHIKVKSNITDESCSESINYPVDSYEYQCAHLKKCIKSLQKCKASLKNCKPPSTKENELECKNRACPNPKMLLDNLNNNNKKENYAKSKYKQNISLVAENPLYRELYEPNYNLNMKNETLLDKIAKSLSNRLSQRDLCKLKTIAMSKNGNKLCSQSFCTGNHKTNYTNFCKKGVETTANLPKNSAPKTCVDLRQNHSINNCRNTKQSYIIPKTCIDFNKKQSFNANDNVSKDFVAKNIAETPKSSKQNANLKQSLKNADRKSKKSCKITSKEIKPKCKLKNDIVKISSGKKKTIKEELQQQFDKAKEVPKNCKNCNKKAEPQSCLRIAKSDDKANNTKVADPFKSKTTSSLSKKCLNKKTGIAKRPSTPRGSKRKEPEKVVIEGLKKLHCEVCGNVKQNNVNTPKNRTCQLPQSQSFTVQ